MKEKRDIASNILLLLTFLAYLIFFLSQKSWVGAYIAGVLLLIYVYSLVIAIKNYQHIKWLHRQWALEELKEIEETEKKRLEQKKKEKQENELKNWK